MSKHVLTCRRGVVTVAEHVSEGKVAAWDVVGVSDRGPVFRMRLPRCACPMHVCDVLHRDGFGVLLPTLRSHDRTPGTHHHVNHCHGNHTERVRRVLDVVVRSYGGLR